MLRLGLTILFAVVAAAGVTAAVLLIGKSAAYTDTVQLTSGLIRGEELTFDEISYKAFKGIPYAAPPIGDLRFKDPQPPEKWPSVRDTRAFGKRCLQPKYTRITSEDCLTLNVVTRSLGGTSLKPVLVWIHGGAFFTGDGTDSAYGPQYFIQHDIVIVTINYRLGALGFLATNTTDASGNWGLKDQVAALKWIQENIERFGGDPKQVTIYGESAGAISVHLHMLSPLSKGLFHRTILSSGSALMSRAVRTPDQMERYSQNMARLLGAPENEVEDPTRRIHFLRHADPKDMTDRIFEVADIEERILDPIMHILPFFPVIENPAVEGAFLTEDPKKLLYEGRFTTVPMMMGVTDLEGGAMFTGLGKKMTPELMRTVEANICQILPLPLKKAVTAKNECAKVAREIGDVYFDGKPFESSLLNFTNLCGDLFVTFSAHEAQQIHASSEDQNSKIYNYYFTFDGKWNIFKKLFSIRLPGAAHGDELMYVFKPNVLRLPNLSPTSPEVATKNRMVGFVANFVKYGDPTPAVNDLVLFKWEPAKQLNSNTMIIGNDLKLENEVLKKRMDFWDKLNEEYLENSEWFTLKTFSRSTVKKDQT